MFYPGIFSSSEHDTKRMRRMKDADLDYPMIDDEDSDSQRALCPEGKKSELFSQAWSLLSMLLTITGAAALG